MGLMNGKSLGPVDHKSKAIEELMAYLDGKDGEELGSAMKPKEPVAEAAEIDPMAEGQMDQEGAEAAIAAEGGSEAGSKMSDEEMAELIEAIQSKLGA